MRCAFCSGTECLALKYRHAPDTPANRPDQSCSPSCFGRAQPHEATGTVRQLAPQLNRITPVILCGGSGTRLWPLSRKSFPKQFVPLIDGKSPLQGDVLWNAGIFLVQAQVLIKALHAHAPEILQSCRQAMVGASQDQSFIRPVVALGTQDLLIIDTPDALLVASRNHAEQVKQVVARLESQHTPQAVQHRLENPGKTELEIIEVQSGSYLGEDDIVRFEDTYDRVPVKGVDLSG